MRARFETQTLEQTVELVHDADIIPIDVDSRVDGFDPQTQRAIVIIGAAAMSAGPTFARGSGGGKHGGGQTPPPSTGAVTVTVSPNPVPAGSGFTATFSGLVSGRAYNVYTGYAVYWLAGDGTVSWAFPGGWTSGAYTFTVYDITGGGFVNVGSTSFRIG